MMRFLTIAALMGAAALAQPAPVRQFIIRLEPVRAGFTLQNVTEEERPLIQRHAAHLKSLLDQGKMKLAGQSFDPKGFWGILIIDAPDIAVATEIMNSDPAIQAKMFRGEVVPFRVVFERPAASPASKPGN
jgi:uncharacterized protein